MDNPHIYDSFARYSWYCFKSSLSSSRAMSRWSSPSTSPMASCNLSLASRSSLHLFFAHVIRACRRARSGSFSYGKFHKVNTNQGYLNMGFPGVFLNTPKKYQPFQPTASYAI